MPAPIHRGALRCSRPFRPYRITSVGVASSPGLTGGSGEEQPAPDGRPSTLTELIPLAHALAEKPLYTREEFCAEYERVRAADRNAKGNRLEDFVVYAFSGNYPRLFKDEGKRRRTLERDRVFTITALPGTLVASWNATELVVDSRHRTETYSSADASVFVSSLRESISKLGLVVAMAGITARGEASAASVIREAYVRDGIRVAVVEDADLQALCRGQAESWLELVHEKQLTSRQGRRYRS